MPWSRGSDDVPDSDSRRAKPTPKDAALWELSLAFYREDQLPPSDRRTEFSQIGGRSFLERNHGGHEWLDVPCGHLIGDSAQLFFIRFDNKKSFLDSLVFRSFALSRDGDHSAPGFDHVPRIPQGGAADRVEDQIHIFDHFLKMLGPVVDHFIGSKLPDKFKMLRRGG